VKKQNGSLLHCQFFIWQIKKNKAFSNCDEKWIVLYMTIRNAKELGKSQMKTVAKPGLHPKKIFYPSDEIARVYYILSYC